MSLSQVLANKLQSQINALRSKQADVSPAERAKIQSQIRQLQSKLDGLK